MCVIIAMVMQTTLMDHTGLGQKGAICGQFTFKLLLSSLLLKHDAGRYHISLILIGLERIYGERQVI